MTHTADPILTNLTPNAEIRKTVAGRALPAPVNWVWGVYDPHPFSCLLFDPPTLPPNWGWVSVSRKKPVTEATAGSQAAEPLSLLDLSNADHRNYRRCQCRQNSNCFFHIQKFLLKKIPYFNTYSHPPWGNGTGYSLGQTVPPPDPAPETSPAPDSRHGSAPRRRDSHSRSSPGFPFHP